MSTLETKNPLDVYIKHAKDLVGLSRKEDLEKQILDAANRVVRNVVTLDADSFYLIGIRIKAEVLILPLGQVNQTEIRLQSPNGIFAPIQLAEGSYTLLIRKDGVVVRSVFLEVQSCFSRQLRYRPSARGSLQSAILVPRDKQWLLDRLAAVLWELDFQMELQTGGKMFFYNQLKISCHILVIPYDFDSTLTLDSDLQFASQVLLLVADDHISSDIFLLQDANIMDFNVVTDTAIPTCFVEFQTLGAPVQLVIDQLRTTLLNRKTSMSAVKIRQEKGSNEDLLLQLLCVWLTRPHIPSESQPVYLKFAYEDYSFLTFDMAQQFTKEILRSPLESSIHCVTQRSNQIEVFASCSERCAWLLSINFDAIATEYCALQAVQEIFWDDVKDYEGLANLLSTSLCKASRMRRRCNVVRKDYLQSNGPL